MKKRAMAILMIGVWLLTMASCGCEHEFTQPTCLVLSTCTMCGKMEGELAAHDLQEATCTEAATCRVCGYTEEEALGHEYSEASCEKAATCMRCNHEKGKALGHIYSEATCVAPKTCTYCEKTLGQALGHDYSQATCTKKATCTRCAETTGVLNDHTYTPATCTSPLTCTHCGATAGEALGHSYVGATCLAMGTCSRCNASGPALGHDYEAATCMTAEICKRCGATGGASLGHTDAGDGYCVRCREKMPIDMNTIIGQPIAPFEYCRNEYNHVGLSWAARNNSGKTINYFILKLYPVNTLGDPIREEYGDDTSKTFRVVGPIKPGEEMGIFHWIGYFPTCEKVTIGEITLEYDDGTTDTGWYGWYTDEHNADLQYYLLN